VVLPASRSMLSITWTSAGLNLLSVPLVFRNPSLLRILSSPLQSELRIVYILVRRFTGRLPFDVQDIATD
jgi:hypothetical protein